MAESTRKPWYAVAIAGGFGAVLGVATLFGLGPSTAAHAQEPHMAAASMAPAPAPGTITLDERLGRIEKAIEGLQRAWDKLPERCKRGSNE